MFQQLPFRAPRVCEPCWSVRNGDRHPDLHPTEHPRAIFVPLGTSVITHRLVGFGNDGIETVCGHRWTTGGLTATFTGSQYERA